MSRLRENLIAAGLMLALLAVFGALWLPLLPNEAGKVAADYSIWLPDLLAGYYWYLHNGVWSLPWFSPAECAGVPFQADPQIGYLSPQQFLTFAADPLSAIRATWLVYAAAGFWGAWRLARVPFRRSLPAALLAAALFMLNGFFAARMAVGHLSFAPVMLLPALCAALLSAPDAPALARPALVLRACVAGVLLAVMIQGGVAVVLPQIYVAAIAVLLLHAAIFGWQKRAIAVFAAGTAIGLCLCAAKLVAAAALYGNFPRDLYPLPGIPGALANTIYVAVRSLFYPVSNDLRDWVGNSKVTQEAHEFAYGVGLAPPLLMLTALVRTLRRGGWRACVPRRPVAAVACTAVILLPLALNFYTPGWNALLKSLPVIGSSSVMLRWFMVMMLPAILGAALAADMLSGGVAARARWIAAGGICLTIAGLAVADRSAWGSNGGGVFDPGPIVQAWHRAHDTGAPPEVTDVVQLFDANHRILMTLERQNGLTRGASVLSCYNPIFGYRLEKLPYGNIRLAHAMSIMNGVVNFKNPACYVYPGANECRPGDQFTEAQADQARKFLDYENYDYRQPLIATLAGWLSLLSLFAVPLAMAWSAWRLRCR